MTPPPESIDANSAADVAARDGISIEPTILDRIRRIPSRTKLLIVLGIALVALGLSGTLNASNGVEVEREEAVSIARDEIDFEPTNADARFIRQGFGLRPVWAVSFSIPADEGDANDFARLAVVEIDAVNSEVLNVIDHGVGG